ncbi:TetR family transcriptional regulator [Frondihabitans sucicola]|uniref:TetR family transcriptional regulator n=1 Tax=Frondihabitans sucicola TaxID=1268041 RepID=A0ABM8GTP2_9MICO|nr:TetR family transcriptional regulator [Frondihabitans sucicola]BDZ51817.1 TetR family transcriptional regulator [Frondihabitans sucicola]
MDTQTASPGGLRAITRDAVRTHLSELAIDLFTEHGFDNVTVEQIAAAAGISARSVHRYFPAKEDLVVGDPTAYGSVVRDAFLARSTDESVLSSLRAAFTVLLDHGGQDIRGKAALCVMTSVPALRARNHEKHLLWASLLTPVVAARLRGSDAELRAQVLVQTALACFDVALTAWVVPGEQRTPAELLGVAFAALPSHGPTPP